jgi:hypothetical protein
MIDTSNEPTLPNLLADANKLSNDAGTIIAHGFVYGEAEAKPIEERLDLAFHSRLSKVERFIETMEPFIAKLEERLRILRFW